MRLVVYGLWHLGCVTASCMAAARHHVVGLDLDESVIKGLNQAEPPVHEPGLAEVIASELRTGRLSFSSRPAEAIQGAEVLWVCIDTPVNDHDEADVAFVRRQLETIVDAIPEGALILISAQVPVGFTEALARDWQGRRLRFACVPENLRLGKALEVFRNPGTIVAGVQNTADRAMMTELFAPFPAPIEWMSIASAEMTKHARNAFLGMSVAFANELARLCESVGADAKEVERGLKSDARIGPRAYVAPGGAFAGGTLARDLNYLIEFGTRFSKPTPLIKGVLDSNEVHKGWVREKVIELLGTTSDPVVAMLGLTYKSGTSTLRRSAAVEQCLWLHDQGVRIQVHDPGVHDLPDELRQALVLCENAEDALAGADVAVIATDWPQFRTLKAEHFRSAMRQPQVIDPNRFLAELEYAAQMRYLTVGKAA